MFYFPGAPPGIAPPPGRCPEHNATQEQPPPCRGLPPVTPAALLAGIQKKTRPNRIQLPWVAEKGSPPPPAIPLSQDTYTSSCCIFSRISEAEQQSIQAILLDDKELETQFTRKKVSSAPITKKNTAPVHKGLLPPAISQKFQIIVRCLKKAFDEPDGWTACKKALLGCRLEKQEISLLLETIPEQGGTRKALEWEEAIGVIRKAQEADPTLQLQDDEDFVAFMSSIPDLHTRLQCMLVMQSFDDLIAKVMRELEAMMDAIEILVRSETLPKLFHAILTVGNFLNEGTALGKRRWFRMETLKRVEELRAPSGGKSLLYFLASRLGPVITNTELATIERAANLSLVMSIQSACRLQDVYNLLAVSSFDESESQIMTNLVEDSEFPDEFAKVGRKFAIDHSEQFKALKDDARRLLVDYQSAVSYFGDVEYFLPFDKKIEDPKCGTRFVPDLFQVCSEFLKAYSAAIREVELERDKKARIIERNKRKLSSVSKEGLPGSPKRIKEERPVVPSRSVVPALPGPVSAPSNLFKVVDSASKENLFITAKAKATGKDIAQSPKSEETGKTAPILPSRRTSLRPSLFGNTSLTSGLQNTSSLQSVQELIAEEPVVKRVAVESSTLRKATIATKTKKSWLSRGVVKPPPRQEKDNRRRESLRAVSGYIRSSVHGTTEGRGSLAVDTRPSKLLFGSLASVAEENPSSGTRGKRGTPPPESPARNKQTNFGSRLAMLRTAEPKRGFLSRKQL